MTIYQFHHRNRKSKIANRKYARSHVPTQPTATHSLSASAGRRVQILQGELTDIKRVNATLDRQIAEAQALPLLQEQARALGFVQADPGDIEYLVVPDYPTGPPPIATPPPELVPTPEPITTIQEAIWYAVKDSVAGLIEGESSER